ncbi:hypothetical protein MTO96_037749 [Rhipicephalus appendiculatus]
MQQTGPTIIGTYYGKSQSKARMRDLPEGSEKQKAPQERTETLDASPWRLTYRPNPAQQRATQASDVQKSANGSTSAACYKELDQRPAQTAERQVTDMMSARKRKNRDFQDVVKITGQIEVVSACPDASYAVESTLQEQAGVKQNSDRLQRSHQHTGNLPEDSSRTHRASQDGIHQPRGRPPEEITWAERVTPANQTPGMRNWPALERR